MKRQKKGAAFLMAALLLLGRNPTHLVTATDAESDFVIFDGARTVPILMDESYEGHYGVRSYTQVRRAAEDLRCDIAMVTGAVDYLTLQQDFTSEKASFMQNASEEKTPAILNEGPCEKAIIIGAVGSSAIIEEIIGGGKFPEADAIRGKWEAYAIKRIENPLDGVGEALVIAGSDARGTIYGIYHLSETIGVSPWYWFSDVPVKARANISVNLSIQEDGPDVKYRGIFINDEERLIDWAKQKFPTENGTPNVHFYQKVFELMLRLRANTLWPAMHEGTTSFNIAKNLDGVPINAAEASRYGIIMASSHCEMMLRCNVGEWWDFYERHKTDYNWQDGGSFDYTQNKEAILDYWRERLETNKDFESILALGIRGIHDGDAECDNLASLYQNSRVTMMTDVIKEQRTLIREVFGSETAVPQVFIPYKGMADLYNSGLKDVIPDDVILMWAEDNYGNLRQTPTLAERARSGGCGIYYHSSYWGWYNPKSYLWLNSTQIYYMEHQLRRAYDCGAQTYWILNVGDIKPGDIVTELFIKTAWDITTTKEAEDYLAQHAMRDYGTNDADSRTFAEAATEFYRLTGTKKAEFFGHENSAGYANPYFSSGMLYPFSVNAEGDEGMRLVNQTNAIVDAMAKLYDSMDERYRDAFYEQIYYHTLCYRDVSEEYVYLWKNQLAASEGRYLSASLYKALSQEARDRIASEQEKYWACNGGKWSSIINYDHPVSYYNMNEGVLLVHDDQYKLPAPSEGLGVSPESSILRFHSKTDNEFYIDVFSQGVLAQAWRMTAPEWVTLSKTEGTVRAEERIIVRIDWTKLDATATGEIIVYDENGAVADVEIRAEVEQIEYDGPSYIETNGKVVIEAEHYSEIIAGEDGSYWEIVEHSGRSGDCMTALPFDALRSDDSAIQTSARLRYHVYFKTTGTFTGTLYRIPTLNEGTDDNGNSRTCRVAVGIDSAAPSLLRGNSATSGAWASNIMHMTEPLTFELGVTTVGWHDIYIYRSDSGIIFDRIVIETLSGAVPASLLGPEESSNNISAMQQRSVGSLPALLESARTRESVVLTEDETTSFEAAEQPLTIELTENRVADVLNDGRTITIHAKQSGTCEAVVRCADTIETFTIRVLPKDTPLTEFDGVLTIPASQALLQTENAYSTASSNLVHDWTLSSVGVSCLPSASSTNKNAWLAVNANEGASLLQAEGTKKATESSTAYGSAPSLNYKITITTPGRYKIYVNTSNPNPDADSYHLFVDGVWQYHSSEGGEQTQQDLWYSYSGSDGINLTRGEHLITICAREAGFTLNTIALFLSGAISGADYSAMVIEPLTGAVSVEYTLIPAQICDAVTAFCPSNRTPSTWSDYAATVRIRPDGTFDAYRGGSGYDADCKIFYQTGKSYRITVDFDISEQMYTVYVNGTLLADAYPFRYAVSDLAKFTVRGGEGVESGTLLAGALTASFGARLVSATARDGTFEYTLSADDSTRDYYFAFYHEDSLRQLLKNSNREGHVTFNGDKVKFLVWQKGTIQPLKDAVEIDLSH
ncbi:MAG: glycosyl hydrolase 115 family protein [Clostridia bacterium]|nr:glycosyl hydrolase 115 family protein [Clostridia bacterium]